MSCRLQTSYGNQCFWFDWNLQVSTLRNLILQIACFDGLCVTLVVVRVLNDWALYKREKWEGYILFVRHLIFVPDCCFCVMVQLRSMSKSKCFLYSCLPCDCLSDCKTFGARTKWRKDPSSATRGKKKASGGWAQTSGRRKRESTGSAEKRKGTEGETTEQSSEQENGCSPPKQRRNGALSVWLAENC